jgi:tetratricopeptide (TPR) repeat protein
VRSQALGYWIIGLCYVNTGETDACSSECQKGLKLNADPFYLEMFRYSFGYACVYTGRLQEGEAALEHVVSYSHKYGLECLEWLAVIMLGVNFIIKGQMTKGFRMLSGLDSVFIANEARLTYAYSEFIRGIVYTQLAFPTAPVRLSLLVKNSGFIVRHMPFAARKAIAHYNKSAQICRDCGFNGTLGKVYLELGRLYQRKGKKELARENLSSAVRLCRECEDTNSVLQAESLLESLGD